MTDNHISLPQQLHNRKQSLTTKRKFTSSADQVQPPTVYSTIPNITFVLPSRDRNDNPSASGNLSPRSQVAHQFNGLNITCGGGVGFENCPNQTTNTSRADTTPTTTSIATTPSPSTSPVVIASSSTSSEAKHTTSSMARLARIPPAETPTPSTSDPMDVDGVQPLRKLAHKPEPKINTPDMSPLSADTSIDDVTTRPRRSARKQIPKATSTPSNTSLSSRQSRSRNRVKTTPARQPSTENKRPPTEKPIEPVQEPNEPPRVVEPIRAALTWKEEEITIFDPDDKDDDGVGMDGVAFEPTPELAKIRDRRRREQLDAYRKQIENDARANRRNKRRQTSPDDRKEVRRVRFLDFAV
ncbi:hypothetical protein CFIMG_007605RA00001 [Ceratocystis fimbriata CBS 114723]|uniref:Uncharacterized protein n=1 Tax=Ceratocystis fimbriata CBS 114723 TaxID=1035309 RepID=A0A2C5WUI2_9PEZI|nr:hypothetical protein CFIMG_007605RA00001 [Ceratocystis fimbriata CBS 114723]